MSDLEHETTVVSTLHSNSDDPLASTLPNAAAKSPKLTVETDAASVVTEASTADEISKPAWPSKAGWARLPVFKTPAFLDTKQAVPFLASLVVHVGLLLVLACWAYTAGRPSDGLLLTAEIGQSESTAFEVVQTFELEPNSGAPESIAEPDLSATSLDIPITPMVSPATDASLESLATPISFASLSAKGTTGIKKPQGSGRGASFFGAYAEGNRFVYVLDSSKSMRGDRWVYACNQLIDSLNGLREGQEFFVICFDLQTSFLFNLGPDRAEYFEADKPMVTRVRRWLRSRTLGIDTRPAEALQYAMQANPDAIFLLSDGELQDNSLLMLRNINSPLNRQRQIPIHTVHLFSAQGRLTLQTIAKENGGTFTPITGR